MEEKRKSSKLKNKYGGLSMLCKSTQSNDLLESIFTGGLRLADYKLLQLVLAKIPLRKVQHTRDGATVESYAPKLEADEVITVSASEYAEVYGVSKCNLYASFDKSTDILGRTLVKFKWADYTDKVALLHRVRIHRGDKVKMDFVFHSEVLPHISELSSKLTTINLENIKNLDSIYAYRLYTLLKMYSGKYTKQKRRGKLVIDCDLEELRDFLSLNEYTAKGALVKSKYKNWKDLKKRVLTIAINEINEHTDISVKLGETKSGSKIESLTFEITANLKNSKGGEVMQSEINARHNEKASPKPRQKEPLRTDEQNKKGAEQIELIRKITRGAVNLI